MATKTTQSTPGRGCHCGTTQHPCSMTVTRVGGVGAKSNGVGGPPVQAGLVLGVNRRRRLLVSYMPSFLIIPGMALLGGAR